MAGHTVRDLLAYDVLVATSLLWFLAQFVRFVFPPLFGTFSELYGVTNTTLGLLYTSMMLAYGGMQFPSGALADRLGTTRVIAGGGVVAAVGAFVAYGVRSFAALFVAAVLIGLGTGAHKTVAINLLNRVYPRRTGGLLGTMDAIGHLGGAGGPAAVALVLAVGLGWPTVYLAVGVAGLALTALFRDRMARRPAAETDGHRPAEGRDGSDGVTGDARAYLRPFLDRRFSAFVLATVAYAVTWSGFTAFLPLYLESQVGLSTELAGLVFGSLFLVALVQPLTGWLADRIGRLEVMVATLGLAGASLVVVLAAPWPLVALLAVPAFGLGGHGFRPVRDAYMVETIPSRVGGGTLGIARTVMIGTSATAPAVVGYLSDVSGFAVAFGALAGVIAFATSLVAVLFVVDRQS